MPQKRGRGQPPKPEGERRTEKASLRYSKEEMKLLQQAYEISGSPNTLSRWIANISLAEAQRIVDSHKK